MILVLDNYDQSKFLMAIMYLDLDRLKVKNKKKK
jgi:hypothetical protein